MAYAEDNRDDRGSNRSRMGKEKIDDDEENRRDTSSNGDHYSRSDKGRSNSRNENSGQPRAENFTALNATREPIMNFLMRNNQLDPPRSLNPDSAQYRNTNKRCSFHNDYWYTTEKCIQLKKEIQRLIDGGIWKNFEQGETETYEETSSQDRKKGERAKILLELLEMRFLV